VVQSALAAWADEEVRKRIRARFGPTPVGFDEEQLGNRQAQQDRLDEPGALFIGPAEVTLEIRVKGRDAAALSELLWVNHRRFGPLRKQGHNLPPGCGRRLACYAAGNGIT
jgi:hypothetical protein